MATYDQSGTVVDELSPVQVTAQRIFPAPEIEEVTVTGKRFNWTPVILAALTGLMVMIMDGQRPKRRRRRR